MQPEENKLEDWEKIIRIKVLKSEYDVGRDTVFPVLPPREGYIIDFDDETGWPYYISAEAFEAKKRVFENFKGGISKMIQGQPRKGVITITSMPAHSSGNIDWTNLWLNNEH